MKIGYARVSTLEQNLEAQVDALKDFGCQQIYTDKISGQNADRPNFKILLERIRKGDTIVVTKIDRIGRSMIDLIQTVSFFEKQNVHFVSLGDSFDTSSPNGRLIFHIFSAFSEYERSIISERTKQGLKSEKKRSF